MTKINKKAELTALCILYACSAGTYVAAAVQGGPAPGGAGFAVPDTSLTPSFLVYLLFLVIQSALFFSSRHSERDIAAYYPGAIAFSAVKLCVVLFMEYLLSSFVFYIPLREQLPLRNLDSWLWKTVFVSVYIVLVACTGICEIAFCIRGIVRRRRARNKLNSK